MDKMKTLIEDFSAQLRDALTIGQKASVQPAAQEIRNIVIAGLGGSGIGGSVVASLLKDELKVPVVVCKDYDIPAFVDGYTLFVASSFSGNTEETVSALEKALKADAQCVSVTSGGTINKMVKDNNMDVINIPGESKSPRANIGYSVIQLLYMFHYKGLISKNFESEVSRLADLLDSEESAIRERAEKLANGMKGYLPILYTDSRMYPIAIRIQQQINENGKHFCHVNEFPEMNHNELVGWEHPEQVLNDSKVYFLHTSYDNPRVKERFKICREVFSQKAASVHDIEAKGQSILEQSFYLIHLTDWVSYFLAQANSVDPFPVTVIDHLKNELTKV